MLARGSSQERRERYAKRRGAKKSTKSMPLDSEARSALWCGLRSECSTHESCWNTFRKMPKQVRPRTPANDISERTSEEKHPDSPFAKISVNDAFLAPTSGPAASSSVRSSAFCVPARRSRTASASARRPFETSHRGEKGRRGVVKARVRAVKVERAKGKRQEREESMRIVP